MGPVRAFRRLAWLNLGCGALLAASMLMMLTVLCVSFALDKPAKPIEIPLVLGLMTLGVLTIAGVILAHGIIHLKRPSLKSAPNLALNSSIILWFIIGGIGREIFPRTVLESRGAGADHSPAMSDAIKFFVPLLVAGAVYRFILKPAALRAFPLVSPPSLP
jgi:hypothetical protein